REFHAAIPRILGLLLKSHAPAVGQLGIKTVAAEKMDPNAALGSTVSITARLGDGANHIGWAAITADPFLPCSRPTQVRRHGVQLPKGIRVEIALAVETDTGK